MNYGNENEMRFTTIKGFHEMFVDLWKWYVVESMNVKVKARRFYCMKHGWTWMRKVHKRLKYCDKSLASH
jgi:hypothetical protein